MREVLASEEYFRTLFSPDRCGTWVLSTWALFRAHFKNSIKFCETIW